MGGADECSTWNMPLFFSLFCGAPCRLLACLAVDPVIGLILLFCGEVFAEYPLLSWVSSVVKIRVSFVE